MLLQAVFLLATACVHVAGHQLTTEQIFRLADSNSDDRLRLEEYVGLMRRINPKTTDADRMDFLKIDDSSDGYVTLHELKTAYAEKYVLPPENISLRNLYDVADKNVDNQLTIDELLGLYSILLLDSSDAKDNFHVADKDEDAELSVKEFLEYEPFSTLVTDEA